MMACDQQRSLTPGHRGHEDDRCLPRFGVAMAALGVVAMLSCGVARGEAPGKTSPVRVACLDVYGTGERGIGPKNLKRCLSESPDFTFGIVTADEIRNKGLARFDVLICPGGSGSKQSKTLDAEGRRAVQAFVKDGGGYMGVCAGAYLASSHYPWSLGLLNAKVVDTKHWARGTGNVTLKLTDEGRRFLGSKEQTVTCIYAQGPLLAPGDGKDLPAYQVLATFGSEIAKNGAPPGVMVGTTAIASGTFGKGRVVCFSPHAEKTKGLEDYIRRAARWAAGRD